MREILMKLGANIAKSITQNDIELKVTGRVLDHSKGNGYCFLTVLMYGLEELGGHKLDNLVAALATKSFPNDTLDLNTGFVSDAWKLAKMVTGGLSALDLVLRTDNINVLRNVISSAQESDKLFIIAKFPGHYIYVRTDGSYTNPLNNRDVDESKVVGWRLWKVV